MASDCRNLLDGESITCQGGLNDVLGSERRWLISKALDDASGGGGGVREGLSGPLDQRRSTRVPLEAPPQTARAGNSTRNQRHVPYPPAHAVCATDEASPQDESRIHCGPKDDRETVVLADQGAEAMLRPRGRACGLFCVNGPAQALRETRQAKILMLARVRRTRCRPVRIAGESDADWGSSASWSQGLHCCRHGRCEILRRRRRGSR